MANDSPYLAKHKHITLNSLDDAMAMIGAGVGPCIFTLSDLSPTFFELNTGLAGEIFQKFTQYNIPVAFVIPSDHGLGERVTELAREHAKHSIIRITPTVEAAHAWILNQ